MSHEVSDSYTTAPRRRERRGRRGVSPEPHGNGLQKPQSCTATEPTGHDVVYAIKSELRSPAPGHPLVVPPSLLVDEVYRSKGRAVAKLREVVVAEMAFEIARGKSDPHSCAWLNAVPVADPDAESAQVVRADGMILRYFVEGIMVL